MTTICLVEEEKSSELELILGALKLNKLVLSYLEYE